MSNQSESSDSSNRTLVNQEQESKIIWEDSDDVYKPIPKSINYFIAERRINLKTKEQVYIKSDALESLKAHLKSNLTVEQGGILFGNAYQDPELGIYVDITAAVAAPATVGTGAHLEFTPHSWLGIMDYAKAQHPDENMVGWYHSHPNLGVFMSGTDMKTQQAFFYHPWCLSIVHDPCRGDIGYFLGKTAQKLTPEIYSYVDNDAKKSTISSESDQNVRVDEELRTEPIHQLPSKEYSNAQVIIYFLILLAIIAFAILLIFNF